MKNSDKVSVVHCDACRHCFSLEDDRREPYNGGPWWFCDAWYAENETRGVDPAWCYCAFGEKRDGKGA